MTTQFSPSAFVYCKNKKNYIFNKIISHNKNCFKYGYSDALNLIVLAIVIIYSVHLPLLIVLGLIYFFIRMFSDMFMYLSVFGHEIESGGNMILGSLN